MPVRIKMTIVENEEPSNDRLKNYFKEIKFVLKIVGVSLEEKQSTGYKIFSFCVFFFLSIMYTSLTYVEAFWLESNVDIDNMSLYIVGFTLATVKPLAVVLNRERFIKLLANLEKPPFTPNSERGGEIEEQLIRRCIKITHIQNVTYWVITFLSISSACIIAFSFRIRSSDYHDWVFPYGPLTILNVTYSPNYEISFGYQCLSVATVGTQFINIDLVTAAVMAHICYQFKILQNNIRRLVYISYKKMEKESDVNSLRIKTLDSTDDEIDGSRIPWKYLQQSVKDAIDYHSAIINIADEMETVFSGLLLVIFLSTLGILCLMIYLLSTMTLDDPQFGRKFAEIASTILQVATVCYWGGEVVAESQKVGQAVFETNFVGTDVRFQKSLAMIIRRSQKPSQLTAGKFSVVSLPTFAWIIRTSYSAFMMIKNVHRKE